MTVWLAERARFIKWPQVHAYNIPAVYQIDSGFLSIQRCLRALNLIVACHRVFSTRLIFDPELGCLRQSIHESPTYPVRLSTVYDSSNKEERTTQVVNKEMWMPFDTEHDGVFRCHFIRRQECSDDDILSTGDLLVFNFHHGSFDGRAVDLFLDQLKVAYINESLQQPRLQYIDYAVQERALLMTEAREYWHEALRGYPWDRQLNLGSGIKPLSARRTGQGSSLSAIIPLEIVRSMVTFAQQLNVTLFQLGLSSFYLFLAQLSSDNLDACVGVIHLNRYRSELASMIGMFVNVLPCRISNTTLHDLSFTELVQKVKEIFLANVQYSYLPYDELINLHRVPNSHLQLPFLQTVFRVDTSLIDYNNTDGIMLGDSCLLSSYTTDLRDGQGPFKFDLEVSFVYDNRAATIECAWAYMQDVFERETIDYHASRFIQLLTQLFGSTLAQLQLPLGEIISIDEKDKPNTQLTTVDYREASFSCPVAVIELHEEQKLTDRIVAVFSQILGCAPTDVDLNKSFFEQGGTSLKALQTVMLLQKEISTQINADIFFTHLTVTRLARFISMHQIVCP